MSNQQKTHTFFCAGSYHFRDIIFYFISLPSKSRSRSQSTIFAMTSFAGKCHNLQKSPTHFCASCYRFRIFFILFLPSKSKLRSRSTISQWHHSMANVKIYKGLPHIFALALTVSKILTLQIFTFKKVGQGHGLEHSQWRPSMENIKIYKR